MQRAFDTLLQAKWPVQMHCTADKDRTGVLVAIQLKNIGIPDPVIVDKYLLSDGKGYRENMETLLFTFLQHEHLQMSPEHKDRIQTLICA
jgi:protein tyrosine/serine phosphatase